MKRLFLTGIKRVLNEEAQKRLDEFDDEDYDDEPVDEYGRNAQWYDEAQIPIPESLKDKRKDYLQFDIENDYDAYLIDITVNEAKFVMAVDHEDEGSTVYMSNGTVIEVVEDTLEINGQIWWNNRNLWQKFSDWCEGIYSIIKKKFKFNTK